MLAGIMRAVETAVAIFVDAEEAARQGCHLRDVIEGADLSDQSLTGGVYWIVLKALGGALAISGGSSRAGSCAGRRL